MHTQKPSPYICTQFVWFFFWLWSAIEDIDARHLCELNMNHNPSMSPCSPDYWGVAHFNCSSIVLFFPNIWIQMKTISVSIARNISSNISPNEEEQTDNTHVDSGATIRCTHTARPLTIVSNGLRPTSFGTREVYCAHSNALCFIQWLTLRENSLKNLESAAFYWISFSYSLICSFLYFESFNSRFIQFILEFLTSYGDRRWTVR